MTHEELCERARRWLAGSRRCEPVFSNVASCREIPDAIGWSSCYKWHGSTVVECKTSLADFHGDKWKRVAWRHPEFKDWELKHSRIGIKQALKEGYIRVELPMMGDFRFYMCQIGVIPAALVEKYAPDHGLLWIKGRRVILVRDAPRRTNVDQGSEIRFLRFAIINDKIPYYREEQNGQTNRELGAGS